MQNKPFKPLHIFRAGTHITTAGESISFSQADITATARSYNTTKHKAPLVKGHPQLDDPAQGWVSGLSCEGQNLFATPEKVSATFAEEVKAGRYGTISAKFYRPDESTNPMPGVWYLRHVGFLGAQPPAIKGLNPPEFAETTAEPGFVCFAQSLPADFSEVISRWTVRSIAHTFRSIRDWIIGKEGVEVADQVIPDYRIVDIEADFIRAEAEAFAAEKSTATATTTTNQPIFSETNKENQVSIEELQAQNARLKADLDKANAEKTVAIAQKRHEANVQFAESLSGKLAPKHVPAIIAVLDYLASDNSEGKPAQFGEGESAKPLVDVFKTLLGELPPVVEFGEVATKGKGTAATSEKNPLLADAENRAGK